MSAPNPPKKQFVSSRISAAETVAPSESLKICWRCWLAVPDAANPLMSIKMKVSPWMYAPAHCSRFAAGVIVSMASSAFAIRHPTPHALQVRCGKRSGEVRASKSGQSVPAPGTENQIAGSVRMVASACGDASSIDWPASLLAASRCVVRASPPSSGGAAVGLPPHAAWPADNPKMASTPAAGKIARRAKLRPLRSEAVDAVFVMIES